MEEHPAAGGAGVNGFGERNEVGLMLVEEVGEVFQFAAVAGQAGEFGKYQAGDVAALHVLHHALGLRVLHDGLAGLPGKVIDLLDLPALAFGVAPGAFLVVFGAFALGLVFGRNPNPDANRFVQDTIFLHSTTSYPKHNSHYKKKV